MVVSMNKVTFDEDTLKLLVEEAVELAVQQEREACIQIVENEAFQYASPVWAFEIVNDIKARGQA